MVIFSNPDDPELAPYKKETWEEFNAKMNRIQLALAKREAIAENILAKYPTDRRRKTQEEIDAEDAYWFPPGPGNQSIDDDPAFQKYLKPVEERNRKSLRDRLLPSNELKASKARDAEEKAASAKRALAAASSDEEEGRSGLGKAKKSKTKHGKTNAGEDEKPLINKALLAQSNEEEGKELVNKALLAQQNQEDNDDTENLEVTLKKSRKRKNKKSKQKNAQAEEDIHDDNANDKQTDIIDGDKMDIDGDAFNIFHSKPLIVKTKSKTPTDNEEAYEGEGEGEQQSDDERKARQEAKKLLKSLRKKEKKQKKREEALKMEIDPEEQNSNDQKMAENSDNDTPEVEQVLGKKHKKERQKETESLVEVDVDDVEEGQESEAVQKEESSKKKKHKKKKSKAVETDA